MQINNLFVTLLLSSAVAAKGREHDVQNGGNVTDGDSVKAQCHKIQRMQGLVTLAGNQTMLDDVTKANTTKEDEIKAKAADAQTQLTTLTANATLMGLCDVQFAGDMLKAECHQIDRMTKLVAAAANTTLVDDLTKNNATKASEFQAMAASAQTKLTEMTANTTLTDACKQLATEQQAKKAEKEAAKQQKAAAAAAAAPSPSATAMAKSAASTVVASTGIFSTVMLVAAMVILL